MLANIAPDKIHVSLTLDPTQPIEQRLLSALEETGNQPSVDLETLLKILLQDVQAQRLQSAQTLRPASGLNDGCNPNWAPMYGH